MIEKDQRVYGKQFLLLCLSSLLFFSSFNMIVPELPNYLTKLGGEDYKGLIIGLFTLTAGLSRPFSGRLADRLGRIPVMVFGALVCVGMSLLYPFVTSVFLFLLLRFFHGFSTGFNPTGISAYVADITPNERRGEAIGVIGLAGSLGMAGGPAIGSMVAMEWGLDALFYTSSFAAFLSVAVLLGMKETLYKPQKFNLTMLQIGRDDIYEPRVKVPAIVMLLSVVCFGTVLTVIPDMSSHLGIENKGLYFSAFTIASVAVRFLAGKASDRWGRVKVLYVSLFTVAVGMFATGLADSQSSFLFAGVIFGLGIGMNSPTIFAWSIDLSQVHARGRAMATMYIALEIGIGLGALLSAWIYANDPTRFPYVFGSAAVMSLMALVYLILVKKQPHRLA